MASKLESLQTDCRRLFVRGLEVQALIGIHDFELGRPQRLVLDIDVYVPLQATTPRRDAIEEVVDYDFVRTAVHERIARGPIALQETLCDDLVATFLAHAG